MLALAGGVGGAKLADGFAQIAGAALTVVVNTADDFEHVGLHVSPDIDTVVYTLGGIANPVTGWGVIDESWHMMQQMKRLGGPDWFRLGDRDVAMHILRTQRLRQGDSLSTITRAMCERLGIKSPVVPMSDDAVRTMVLTADGELGFQDYFVRLQCNVAVSGFRFAGIDIARPSAGFIAALDDTHDFIAFCPSNPFVSVDPILSLPGIRERLAARKVPAIAVSPIIGGAAVKGPAAKMMKELGLDVSPLSVARHYRGLIDGFVIDTTDAAMRKSIEAEGVAVLVTNSIMKTAADRKRLAEECIAFAASITAKS